MIDKKYFCYEIYKNISIWSDQNKVKYNPCSIFQGHIKETKDVDIAKVWNSPEHLKIKQMVETDTRIPGCDVCYQEEAAGRTSRRNNTKKLYEDFHCDTNINLNSPQSIDYSVGNLCNLKCVICGPNSSTSWLSDYQKMSPDINIELFKYNKNIQKLLDDESVLRNIKTIHFHGGGEPLLSNNHLDLLNKIKDVKGLKDVRVFYNTNGTVIPNDTTMELWEQCLLVELYFSIDDISSRFEYQRTGANWEKVCNNIEIMKKIMPHNHMFNVNCVWSLLNLYYLDEVFDWYNATLKTNRYGDPSNFILQKAVGETEIKNLTESSLDVLKNKFSLHPRLFDLVKSIPKGTEDNQVFWNYINKLDSIRNTEFRKVFPEWSLLI